MNAVTSTQSIPNRIARLDLPERFDVLGTSLRSAERELEANARGKILVDLTYADTKRFPPPHWAIEEFTIAATRGGMSYTPYRGDGEVRARVAENVSRFLGINVDPASDLIFTPGTQAALFAALAAIVKTGDLVLLADPDYMFNERMLRFFGATVEHVPLIWEHHGNPTLDLEYLEAAFHRKPRLLLFSHPSNPTGAVYDASIIQQVAQLAVAHDILVIVDELYSRLVYDGRPFHHLAAADGMINRTITLLGPSKTESMSGYRVGVAIAPPAIINRMEDVQSITSLRAPAYAQHALVHWLANDQQFVIERVREYQQLRDYTVAQLSQCELIDVVPSGGTAYLFPRVVGIEASDQRVAMRLQDEAGVIVNPGYQSGPRGLGHFRICFAQNENVLATVLGRITDTLKLMQKRS